MARRSPQAQVAVIAAFVFLLVAVSLTAVLVIGVADGVSGSGPLVLAGLALGVFALGIRLLLLARRPPRSRPSPRTSAR